MRHRKKRNKITKTTDQRRAIFRSLASALILKEKITTTESRAKKIRPFLEKTISRAKHNTISNRRFFLKDFSPKTVDKLFKDLAIRYKEKNGGYLKIIKIGPRKNDSAQMAIVELLKS